MALETVGVVMTFSELLSEYLDLRDVAREAETVIEPAAQCRRRNERIAELLAEMNELVHAAGVKGGE